MSLPVPDTLMTADDMIARARALQPALRERAQRCEMERHVLDETVADFKAAGLHLIGVPARFGGLDLELDTAFAAAIEVGRACGSSAWMASQWPMHNWFIGLMSEEAQQDVWGKGPNALSSTVSAVKESKITKVDGGFRVSGRWALSSGVDHADWLILLNAGDPTGGVGMGLVAKSDFQIVDDWWVMGLRGTGSKSVVIKDAFVPSHRVLGRSDLMSAGPRAAKATGSLMYLSPIPVIFPWTLVSPVLGMVQGMLDEVTEQLPRRRHVMSGKAQAGMDAFRMRYSEASVLVETMLGLFRDSMDGLLARARAGMPTPMQETMRLSRNRGFAIKLAMQAAEILFDCGGGGVIYDHNPMQRLYRDAKAASRHTALNIEDSMMNYTSVTFGLEIPGMPGMSPPKPPAVA